MKSLLLGLAVAAAACTAQAAAAGPIYLVEAGDHNLVLLDAAVDRHDGVVAMHTAIAFNQPLRIAGRTGALMLSDYEFDCLHERVRVMRSEFLDQARVSQGVEAGASDWLPVEPSDGGGTGNHRLMLDFACRKADGVAEHMPALPEPDLWSAAKAHWARVERGAWPPKG